MSHRYVEKVDNNLSTKVSATVEMDESFNSDHYETDRRFHIFC